ncbi:cutinase family protein [Actinomadura rudentiformis]|uniref:Cutinase family protein n=1 Tax=Actinomadura rudentiformis TaxID=359158 RepID=A0A6H9YLL3_9ACTN|nr:cutinase family protein [Actinomadura rudentiformis]KAB2340350.1 cutinase family protein [Actinomadura rudentiformis]
MRIPWSRKQRRASTRIATASAILVCGGGLAITAATPAQAAACTTVEVVSARGTFEPGTAGLIVGDQVYNTMKRKLQPLRSTSLYSVKYPASIDLSGPSKGTIDLVNHIKQQAQSCPSQKFVLVGYSQGAFVVDNAIGLKSLGDAKTTIPSEFESRIAAVMVFGDPSHLIGKNITTPLSTPYWNRAKDFCAAGDPVCGNGFNVLAHLSYGGNANEAADFAISKL